MRKAPELRIAGDADLKERPLDDDERTAGDDRTDGDGDRNDGDDERNDGVERMLGDERIVGDGDRNDGDDERYEGDLDAVTFGDERGPKIADDDRNDDGGLDTDGYGGSVVELFGGARSAGDEAIGSLGAGR